MIVQTRVVSILAENVYCWFYPPAKIKRQLSKLRIGTDQITMISDPLRVGDLVSYPYCNKCGKCIMMVIEVDEFVVLIGMKGTCSHFTTINGIVRFSGLGLNGSWSRVGDE
jgi:hypothetical protein